MKKITSFFILVSFVFSCVMPPLGWAESFSAIGLMPPPGTAMSLSEAFTPVHLQGMIINANDPFKLDFIIAKGDENLPDSSKRESYSKLIKYFLAALAVPDTEQWVNLSPYEKDRIIPESFGRTEMGRDLLAQDYLLKQIASSLTSPESDLGKKFWERVYAQAHDKFGTTDIPTDVINKVWIVPEKAVIYEKSAASSQQSTGKENSVAAYVLENRLKVMIDSDYVAANQRAERVGGEVPDPVNPAVAQSSVGARHAVPLLEQSVPLRPRHVVALHADIAQDILREVVIPELEKEVNEGKNFAPLRQVYSGMLLATWYKRALKDSILNQVYSDKAKVSGVEFRRDEALPRLYTPEGIYQQYLEAFKRGVFNMIKEDVDRYTQEVIPRKYFSGGASNLYDAAMQVKRTLGSDDASKMSIAQISQELVTTLLQTSIPVEHFVPLSTSLLGDQKFDVQLSAVAQLGNIAEVQPELLDKNAVLKVIDLFSRSDKFIQKATLVALQKIAKTRPDLLDQGILLALMRSPEEKSREVKVEIVKAVGVISAAHIEWVDESIIIGLLEIIKLMSRESRYPAVAVLGEMAKSRQDLAKIIFNKAILLENNPMPGVRETAALVFGEISEAAGDLLDKKIVSDLVGRVKDENDSVRVAAVQSLRRVFKSNPGFFDSNVVPLVGRFLVGEPLKVGPRLMMIKEEAKALSEDRLAQFRSALADFYLAARFLDSVGRKIEMSIGADREEVLRQAIDKFLKVQNLSEYSADDVLKRIVTAPSAVGPQAGLWNGFSLKLSEAPLAVGPDGVMEETYALQAMRRDAAPFAHEPQQNLEGALAKFLLAARFKEQKDRQAVTESFQGPYYRVTLEPQVHTFLAQRELLRDYRAMDVAWYLDTGGVGIGLNAAHVQGAQIDSAQTGNGRDHFLMTSLVGFPNYVQFVSTVNGRVMFAKDGRIYGEIIELGSRVVAWTQFGDAVAAATEDGRVVYLRPTGSRPEVAVGKGISSLRSFGHALLVVMADKKEIYFGADGKEMRSEDAAQAVGDAKEQVKSILAVVEGHLAVLLDGNVDLSGEKNTRKYSPKAAVASLGEMLRVYGDILGDDVVKDVIEKLSRHLQSDDLVFRREVAVALGKIAQVRGNLVSDGIMVSVMRSLGEETNQYIWQVDDDARMDSKNVMAKFKADMVNFYLAAQFIDFSKGHIKTNFGEDAERVLLEEVGRFLQVRGLESYPAVRVYQMFNKPERVEKDSPVCLLSLSGDELPAVNVAGLTEDGLITEMRKEFIGPDRLDATPQVKFEGALLEFLLAARFMQSEGARDVVENRLNSWDVLIKRMEGFLVRKNFLATDPHDVLWYLGRKQGQGQEGRQIGYSVFLDSYSLRAVDAAMRFDSKESVFEAIPEGELDIVETLGQVFSTITSGYHSRDEYYAIYESAEDVWAEYVVEVERANQRLGRDGDIFLLSLERISEIALLDFARSDLSTLDSAQGPTIMALMQDLFPEQLRKDRDAVYSLLRKIVHESDKKEYLEDLAKAPESLRSLVAKLKESYGKLVRSSDVRQEDIDFVVEVRTALRDEMAMLGTILVYVDSRQEFSDLLGQRSVFLDDLFFKMASGDAAQSDGLRKLAQTIFSGEFWTIRDEFYGILESDLQGQQVGGVAFEKARQHLMEALTEISETLEKNMGSLEDVANGGVFYGMLQIVQEEFMHIWPLRKGNEKIDVDIRYAFEGKPRMDALRDDAAQAVDLKKLAQGVLSADFWELRGQFYAVLQKAVEAGAWGSSEEEFRQRLLNRLAHNIDYLERLTVAERIAQKKNGLQDILHKLNEEFMRVWNLNTDEREILSGVLGIFDMKGQLDALISTAQRNPFSVLSAKVSLLKGEEIVLYTGEKVPLSELKQVVAQLEDAWGKKAFWNIYKTVTSPPDSFWSRMSFAKMSDWIRFVRPREYEFFTFNGSARQTMLLAIFPAGAHRVTDPINGRNVGAYSVFRADVQTADLAMKGGIDLNSSSLDLQIKRDGAGVVLPLDQQDLGNIRIDGLVPVIIDIKPVVGTPFLSEAILSAASSV